MAAQRDPRKYRTIEVKIRDLKKCHMCGTTPLADDIIYCPSCGFPQRGTEFEQRKFILSRRVKRSEIRETQGDIGVGRLILFILSGFNFLVAAFYYFNLKSATGAIGEITIAVLYAGLGVWAIYKPYAALLTGLLCYCTFIAVNFLINPVSIFSALVIKAMIFGGFIYGMSAVRKAEKLKKELELSKMNIQEQNAE
ncbi:MAG TPA: hypothetical protein VL651_14130 [Bacteroidia bacterium]|jgi:hypothetical protein|nr:hypothetical protein [Bacteroidia bacterium]